MKIRAKKLWGSLRSLNLTLLLSIALFLIIAAVLSLTGGTLWFMVTMGYLQYDQIITPATAAVFLYGLCTLLVICIIAALRLLVLKPIYRMVADMQLLAAGDFSVRIPESNWLRPKELREFAAAFNTAAKELDSTELLRKDFINNFSHEFKTPITSLGGFADLILEDENMPQEEQREYLGIISMEAHRLASLANNVLSLSRVEAQTVLTDAAAFNLTEQLRQTVLMMEQKWISKHLDIQIEAEECTFTGSEALLKEVWVNLLDNAVKFSPPGGDIKLTLHRDDSRVLIAVQDYGIGMDSRTQAHIFNQFFQGDTSHKTEGNGLGLAMVKKIVTLHGGNVTVESTLGEGSKFIVLLPYAVHPDIDSSL